MAKLTREERRKHEQALKLLQKDVLTDSDKEIIFTYWHEGAGHINSEFGAFFTPLPLAFEFGLSVVSGVNEKASFVDLCAGIGVLTYAVIRRHGGQGRYVCIDANPDYVEVGKKLVPEAEWYCMDITDAKAMESLGLFDYSYSNPPFGKNRYFKKYQSEYYRGSEAEYITIDVASKISRMGNFIIPQAPAGFSYSGQQKFRHVDSGKYRKFKRETGLALELAWCFDTTDEGYKLWINDDGDELVAEWKGVNIIVEFVDCDFSQRGQVDTKSPEELKKDSSQQTLFTGVDNAA